MERVDKRTVSEVEHSFVEFCDRVVELGFKFEPMSGIEIHYCKGEAAQSPHNMINRIRLVGDDFVSKEEPEEEDKPADYDPGP